MISYLPLRKYRSILEWFQIKNHRVAQLNHRYIKFSAILKFSFDYRLMIGRKALKFSPDLKPKSFTYLKIFYLTLALKNTRNKEHFRGVFRQWLKPLLSRWKSSALWALCFQIVTCYLHNLHMLIEYIWIIHISGKISNEKKYAFWPIKLFVNKHNEWSYLHVFFPAKIWLFWQQNHLK